MREVSEERGKGKGETDLWTLQGMSHKETCEREYENFKDSNIKFAR